MKQQTTTHQKKEEKSLLIKIQDVEESIVSLDKYYDKAEDYYLIKEYNELGGTS